jgi:hypothetical protein
MRHPFALTLADLETLELDLDTHASQVTGGMIAITLAMGENGGNCYAPPKPICPPPKPTPTPCPPVLICDPKPPEMTTMAIGEEGGCPPPVYTKALCETGGMDMCW